MSERLRLELHEWDRLRDHIWDFQTRSPLPCASSPHRAVQAALTSIDEDRKKREEEIRKEFAAEFQWEAFVENGMDVVFHLSDLNAKILGVLNQRVSEVDNNKFPDIVRLEESPDCGWRDGLPSSCLPSLIEFLINSRAEKVELTVGAMLYSITVKQDPATDNNPLILDVENKCILRQLLNFPQCSLKSIKCNNQQGVSVEDVGRLVEDLECFGEGLEELNLGATEMTRTELQNVIAALARSRDLQVFKVEGGRVTFDSETSPEQAIESLLQQNKSLQTLNVRESMLRMTHSLCQAIMSHPNLKTLSLPGSTYDPSTSIPLIKHCANTEHGFDYLGLDGFITTRTKTACPEGGVSVKIFQPIPELFECIGQIPTISELTMSGFTPTRTCFDLFVRPPPTCAISGLSISPSGTLSDEDLELFSVSTQNYTKLKKVELSRLSLKRGIQRFCPSSNLSEVSLQHVLADATLILEVAATTLKEQQHLQTLSVLSCDGVGTAAPFPNCLRTILRTHPSLKTLEVWFSGILPKGFLAGIFGAVVDNPCITALQCNMVPRGEPSQEDLLILSENETSLIEFLPKLKFLQKLCFRIIPMTESWRRSPLDWRHPQLELALRQNTSLTSWCSLNISRALRQLCTSKILPRNKLLLQSGKIVKHQGAIPSGLWPHIVFKLGNQELDGDGSGQASPLFSLLRQRSAEMVFVLMSELCGKN